GLVAAADERQLRAAVAASKRLQLERAEPGDGEFQFLVAGELAAGGGVADREGAGAGVFHPERRRLALGLDLRFLLADRELELASRERGVRAGGRRVVLLRRAAPR